MQSLAMGRIASFYYMRHQTMATFAQALGPGMDVQVRFLLRFTACLAGGWVNRNCSSSVLGRGMDLQVSWLWPSRAAATPYLLLSLTAPSCPTATLQCSPCCPYCARLQRARRTAADCFFASQPDCASLPPLSPCIAVPAARAVRGRRVRRAACAAQ